MYSTPSPKHRKFPAKARLADWLATPRTDLTRGAPLLDAPTGDKLTHAGAEVASLLERYRVLSPREVIRLRTLSAMLSMNDLEAIARSETLSHAMFDFYQDHGRDLRLPRGQFLRLMTVCLILAGMFLVAAHIA